MPTETAVVVLAAGRGKRMGGPKALMQFGGDVWWKLQQRALKTLDSRIVWVVSEDVKRRIEADSASFGMNFVVSDPDAPMFASVLAGIRAARGSDVFVLPVDTPCPGRAVFEALAGAGPVAIPEHASEAGHPVFLSKDWIDEHLANAEARADALRLDVLIEPDVVRTAVDDPRVAVNLNTPDDVAEWLAMTDEGEGS